MSTRLIMFDESDSGANPVGYYDDDVVRTGDGWRIAPYASVRSGSGTAGR